jgi:hypothetical protein
MELTPEEARKKLCPVLTHGSKSGRPTSHKEQGEYLERCHADKCMFWKWRRKMLDENKPTEGYCGLVGRLGLGRQ